MQEKKRIFITGISGFIGFHLALFLQKRGDLVMGCDNMNTYYDIALKQMRKSLLEEAGIAVDVKEISDLAYLKEVLRNEKITHVVHLAAEAGVRHSIVFPQEFIQSNIAGFVQVMEAMKGLPIRLVYASSSSVYGENRSVPFKESDCTDFPVSLYGMTKKANELIAYNYYHLFQIPSIGLRYFTVYGPYGRPDMAYYKFTKAILEEMPIDIYNHGNMARDFTYIDDVVTATAAAVDSDCGFEVFNIGNHFPEKLMDMVTILENLLGKKAEKRFLAMQEGDVTQTCADISKAQEKLGYCPTTTLEQGLSNFVEWYQNCYLISSHYRYQSKLYEHYQRKPS